MRRKTKWYSYLIVFILGILALILALTLSSLFDMMVSEGVVITLVIFVVVYGITGLAAGVLWPCTSWKWGLLLALPLMLVLFLSLSFAGQFMIFLKKDLPLVVSSLLFSCLGAYIGNLIVRKKQAHAPTELG
jgi:fucose permease